MRRPISYWRRGTLRWTRPHPRCSSQPSTKSHRGRCRARRQCVAGSHGRRQSYGDGAGGSRRDLQRLPHEGSHQRPQTEHHSAGGASQNAHVRLCTTASHTHTPLPPSSGWPRGGSRPPPLT
ncbi:hypothetical protein LSCM4_08254 [Leishmania orientalis]|uniref:Uncharacterized protein n=1 Tax=Leishmania orientalis TaxID=2249476 RepID=A0A836KYW4_9TRYP|nr:hypothetical protein LSCM4_08254 [Leishmania orientalis]